MGFVKLELPVPQSSMVLAEPDPYWTLDSLIAELNSFDIKSPSIPVSSPPTLSRPVCRRLEEEKTGVRVDRAFIMCISDDDTEDAESDSEESSELSLMRGTRFSCPEANFIDSEGSDYELDLEEPRNLLMDKTSLAESFLFELEREHQLKIKEEIRKRASALEAEVRNENARSLSTIARLEKHTEARREMDRRLDKQYQRKIAEALDCHLSIVQRDHEQRSQIEERRIKDDALEEARKKEKALHEEKVRQAKAEAEAREAARIAEEKRKAALEVASVSLREHLGNDEGKTSKTIPGETTGKQLDPKVVIKEESPIEMREVAVPSTRTGVVVTAADSALKAAAERLAKLDKGSELYNKLVSSSDKDFDNYQRQIARRIRQLTGTVENVRTKSSELSSIMKDPRCPYPVSLMIFSKKILNLCENPGASFDGIAFAVGHVIVRVTAVVPATMDFVLAEFHKACIYTVPKFMQPSKVTNRAKEYRKLIGYREENGKIENTDSYLDRVESYIKLYAALVQTEIGDIPNPHGIKEGWAWLARFLNMLPANRFTAVALEAFLKMSGFALFRKYKAQFRKMLNVISEKFLPALKAQGGSDVSMIINKLETYLEKKLYLKEPDGWRLETTLSSRLHMA